MLFTITREEYQRYKDTAGPCRQYILDHFPRMCSVVDTFNRYFGTENVDIYGTNFSTKSLLLVLLEQYEESSENLSLTEFLDRQLRNNSESGVNLFEDLSIYVHWPSVVVTNERNQSVTITDLYAKVAIEPTGRLRNNFTLTRSSYSYEQYTSGYLHSHVNGIVSDPSMFQYPCLGSGPLRRTQDTLSSYNSADLWDLFCVELDRYVHVESIAGIPYRYLDRIGTQTLMPLSFGGQRYYVFRPIVRDDDLSSLFKKFFKYVLAQKKMRFAYLSGMFVSAYSDTEWVLKLSKMFLKYYAMMVSMNKTDVETGDLISANLLHEVKISNNIIYRVNGRSPSTYSSRAFSGQHVLYFKGEDILSHVDNPIGSDSNTYYVLSPVLALSFLEQCLNYLNIYEHEKRKNTIVEESEVISTDSNGGSGNNRCKNAFRDYSLSEERIAISI